MQVVVRKVKARSSLCPLRDPDCCLLLHCQQCYFAPRMRITEKSTLRSASSIPQASFSVSKKARLPSCSHTTCSRQNRSYRAEDGRIDPFHHPALRNCWLARLTLPSLAFFFSLFFFFCSSEVDQKIRARFVSRGRWCGLQIPALWDRVVVVVVADEAQSLPQPDPFVDKSRQATFRKA